MDTKFTLIVLVVVLFILAAGVDIKLDSTPYRVTSCTEDNSFTCDEHKPNQQCVPMSVLCNGVADCSSGKDESVEICGCLPTEFQCNTTTCIDKMKRCDTHSDCEDGLDEQNCETYICPQTTHVKCDNHFCIPRNKRCDFHNDCGDDSDEKNCPRRDCLPLEFRCNNSECTIFSNVCDGIRDCVDGSDEDQSQCDKHARCLEGFYIKRDFVCDGWIDCNITHSDELNCGECEVDQYRCPNTQCINEGNVCDGHCDCLSCADEDNCDTYGCVKEERYKCRGGLHPERCIDKSRVCDMVNDCKDSYFGNDEYYCWSNNNCTEYKIKKGRESYDYFFCREGRCIEKKLVCDNKTDCLDGEDEDNCGVPACVADDLTFKCRDGNCVPKSKRCDAARDCYDWSDEMDCESFQCPEFTTKCKSGHCVDSKLWCDYFRDCPDGSDETDCGVRPDCTEGEFRCTNGQCIDQAFVCFVDRDLKRMGCADGSNIIHCANHTCKEGEYKCRGSYCISESRHCDSNIDCAQSRQDEEDCDYPCPVDNKVCVCNGREMNCEGQNLTEVPKTQKLEQIYKLRMGNNHLNLTNSTFLKSYYDKVTYLDLSNNSLTEIPIHLFDTLWQLSELSLSDNNITTIKNGTFLRLSQLKHLHLSGNKIATIEEDAFASLRQLAFLDLSNQQLTHLYKNMFKGLKTISTLNLSGNQIRSIENGAFNTLINVVSIDLSNTQIESIGENVFLGLPKLRFLKTDSYRFCCLAQHVECLPEPDEFSSCEDLMSNHVLRVSIWVLGIIALCGNIVVIIWRVRDFRGGRVHSFLITNLAIGDFLMGVYLLIIAGVDTHYRGVYIIHDHEWRHSSLCQFAGFVSTFSSELSVLTLTTITLDRLICILFPLKRTRLSLKQAIIVMGLMWSLVFLLAMLPLMGMAYFEGFYGRSGVCLALHVTPQRPPGWEYSVGVFLVLNFTSFLLIAFSYLWMFSVAKKTRSAVRTAESKNDNAMARRMTLIVMTDFCCWVPIIVLGFVSLAGARADSQVYAWIAVFVLPLNSATNPVIYTLSTAPFLGNVRKRANRFRKSFINSFTAETKHSYVDDSTCNSYCERKSPYRQLELIRLRSLNNSPPLYYNNRDINDKNHDS